MNTEVLHLLDNPAVLRHARINAEDGERFGVVSAQGRRYWLKPAVGCLLRPAVGDSVLVSLEGDEGYILSVLERGVAQPAQLQVDGDLCLSLPTGALSIGARDGLSLDAGPCLALRAEQAAAQLGDAQLGADSLRISGQRVASHWVERDERSVRHIEQAVDYHAEYGDSQRRVHGHDDLHAGSLRQRIDKDWSLRGETLDLFANVTVAIDGDRIKLG